MQFSAGSGRTSLFTSNNSENLFFYKGPKAELRFLATRNCEANCESLHLQNLQTKFVDRSVLQVIRTVINTHTQLNIHTHTHKPLKHILKHIITHTYFIHTNTYKNPQILHTHKHIHKSSNTSYTFIDRISDGGIFHFPVSKKSPPEFPASIFFPRPKFPAPLWEFLPPYESSPPLCENSLPYVRVPAPLWEFPIPLWEFPALCESPCPFCHFWRSSPLYAVNSTISMGSFLVCTQNFFGQLH